ncbi:MAG: hypothetical protein ACOCV4_07930 [Myxococcota bacterium]
MSLLILAGLGTSHAQDARWVRVHLEGEGWPEGFRASVLKDLRAGLGRTGVDVEEVDEDRSRRPSAEVTLTIDDGARVRIALGYPAADGKRTPTRVLSLDRVPEESRSWTVAVAAEELLRVHMAEGGSSLAPPVPSSTTSAHEPSTTATVNERPPPAPAGPTEPGPNAMGARGALEHYFGGVTQGGADLVYQRWFHPRVFLELAAGARGMRPADAPHGTIGGWMALGELAVGGIPWHMGAAVHLEALAFLRASAVAFRGRPDEGVRGRTAIWAAADTGARLRLAWRTAGSWTLRASLLAGVALRPIHASDTDETVLAASGMLLGGALSVSVGM